MRSLRATNPKPRRANLSVMSILSSPTYCIVTVTVPVSVMAPEVPVTLIMYVPGVVPDVTTLDKRLRPRSRRTVLLR